MKPFNVDANLAQLTATYPSVNLLLNAANLDNDVCNAISRLWLSEGIPFAFRNNPAVYEALRLWFANQLNIQAKEITIIGSGRIGFSLGTNIGQDFGEHSDLDMTAVSFHLFGQLRYDFDKWKDDYLNNNVSPLNAVQKKYWDGNLICCPKNLNNGFIDTYKIPSLKQYPTAQNVQNTLWTLNEKLKITDGAPKIQAVSLRVYQDWDSFMRQMAINLRSIASRNHQMSSISPSSISSSSVSSSSSSSNSPSSAAKSSLAA